MSLFSHAGAIAGGVLGGGLGASVGGAYDYLHPNQPRPGTPGAQPLGPTYTDNAAQQQQRNAATDQWRQHYLGDINQWQQGRLGYAQALANQFTGAANQGAETQNRDYQRQNTFNQARRGTRHGSADYTAQGRLQAGYAQQLAQI